MLRSCIVLRGAISTPESAAATTVAGSMGTEVERRTTGTFAESTTTTGTRSRPRRCATAKR